MGRALNFRYLIDVQAAASETGKSGKEVELLSEFLTRGVMPFMKTIAFVISLIITYALIVAIKRK